MRGKTAFPSNRKDTALSDNAHIPVATDQEVGRCSECDREWPNCLCYTPPKRNLGTIVWIDAFYPTIQPVPRTAATPRCPNCGFFGCVCEDPMPTREEVMTLHDKPF